MKSTTTTSGVFLAHSRTGILGHHPRTRFSESERLRRDVTLNTGHTRPHRSDTRAQETTVTRSDEKYDHQDHQEGEKRREDHPDDSLDTTAADV